MNALALPLTEDEKVQIAGELEKLFAFQDRPLPDRKKALLVSDICSHGIPFPALISGIRSLFSEDLKSIKLSDIVQACQEKIDRGEYESTQCNPCGGRGYMLLVGNESYEKMFACICSNAGRWIGHRLARWNGDLIQIVQGATFQVPERFRGWDRK